MEEFLPTVRAKLIFGATVVLSTFGLFGNMLSFGIFVTKKFRGQSMFTYLTVVVLLNITTMTYLWPLYVFSIAKTTIVCQILYYTVYVFFKVSAFLNSIVSIDHVFAILAPFKFAFRKKMGFQIGVIITTFIVVIGIDVPYALYTGAVSYGNDTYWCTLIAPISIRTGVNASTIVLSTIVPFAIMIICSLIIALHFFKSKSTIKKSELSRSRESKLTKMFLSLNILFIVIHLPFCIINLYGQFFVAGTMPPLVFDLILIFGYLAYGHKAFQFLIFFFSNTLFREKALSIFCSRWRSPKGLSKSSTLPKTNSTNVN